MDSIAPPPVPPRLTSSTYGQHHPQSSWTSMANPAFSNSFYPTSYSSFGNAGAGYPHYSHHHQSMSSFLPTHAQGPFETVESVVHTVSSVSLLLDSTYNALLASVRSVLAVGEQLSRMRSQFGHLYTALVFSRLVTWCQDHLGWLFGRHSATPDLIWNNVKKPDPDPKRPSQWPLLVYMAFLIGAPLLTWRFAQNKRGDGEDDDWTKGQGEHFVARCQHSFESTREDELSFQAGDLIKVAPTALQSSGDRGWLLASLSLDSDNNVKSGLVPANRIKILGKKVP